LIVGVHIITHVASNKWFEGLRPLSSMVQLTTRWWFFRPLWSANTLHGCEHTYSKNTL
jgi:hypothetical protein